jgi:hypothetical protein
MGRQHYLARSPSLAAPSPFTIIRTTILHSSRTLGTWLNSDEAVSEIQPVNHIRPFTKNLSFNLLQLICQTFLSVLDLPSLAKDFHSPLHGKRPIEVG